MQSAFVNIGLERTAFLHVADIIEAKKDDAAKKADVMAKAAGQTIDHLESITENGSYNEYTINMYDSAARAQAETDAQAFEARARKTIAQAARDTVLDVQAGLMGLFERLLAKDVAAALAAPAETARLALAAVTALGSGAADVDVAAGERLAAALKAQLAADAANLGFDAVLPIVPCPMSLAEAMQTETTLAGARRTAAQIVSLAMLQP